MNCRIN